MDNGMADLFLRYDYAETKDLAKAFLTLVSGILVFSITFSDKVVGGAAAPRPARLALAACWVSLICALIACGFALLLITAAAGDAIYGGGKYLTTAWRAWYLMIFAGLLFAGGLIAIAVAGILSLFGRSQKCDS